MSSPAESRPETFRATAEEYLRFEYDAEFRHEWRDGVVTAMAGGTPRHAKVAMNVGGETRQRLKGSGCGVYNSDLRVRALRSGLYHYPDVTVVCGEPEFDPQDEKRQTIVNPKVIVEVLSPSTEADDRGDKFTHYREIESLEEYVLVSQKSPKVETFHRGDDGRWVINHVVEDMAASVRLRSLDIELPLAEIYENVLFDAPPEPHADGS